MFWCFYHTDLDGYCSAYVINKKYKDEKIIFKKFNYGYYFPWYDIKKEDTVILVDISLPISDLFMLNGYCNLIWIDHHISIINKYKQTDIKIKGIQNTSKAACEHTWCYFFPNETIPYFIKLLSDYDNWNNSDINYWNNEVLPFNYGMQAYSDKLDFENIDRYNNFWRELETKNLKQKIINEGKAILNFLDIKYKEQCNAYAYFAKLDKYKLIVLNTPFLSSQIFNSIDKKLYDIMAVYRFNGQEYSVSLYTEKENINCDEIASKYNGGGHKGAAGFRCQTLPWKFIERYKKS